MLDLVVCGVFEAESGEMKEVGSSIKELKYPTVMNPWCSFSCRTFLSTVLLHSLGYRDGTFKVDLR